MGCATYANDRAAAQTARERQTQRRGVGGGARDQESARFLVALPAPYGPRARRSHFKGEPEKLGPAQAPWRQVAALLRYGLVVKWSSSRTIHFRNEGIAPKFYQNLLNHIFNDFFLNPCLCSCLLLAQIQGSDAKFCVISEIPECRMSPSPMDMAILGIYMQFIAAMFARWPFLFPQQSSASGL